MLSSLLVAGITMVSGVPLELGECKRFGSLISSSRDTEWGEVFNVKSTPDQHAEGILKKDLAYSSEYIDLNIQC